MRNADLSDFSAVLLELHRCADELPLGEFQESALELVRPLAPPALPRMKEPSVRWAARRWTWPSSS
jgi:hypothetical protein